MLYEILAQADQLEGPLGPEFGKASPIGLFVLVVSLVAVLFIGWRLSRRIARLNRRQRFAEDNGLDVFDTEAIDKALKEAGLYDQAKRTWF
ncbi:MULTISPECIES: hypothetical protein [Corynebacterium]|uniref:hypothetical protein n=1 Tax=Corynebacterium TaxID=1716 RepID=UPI00124F37AE|nr:MULTISPECIES: hypothetical protein [Corynebacterium]MBV7281233.1 hypothetical protein [Corynebacterium sp. TAE3-ERU30]MBV7301803.1 hypothetical protein [Corynebacterium sp. TAE3-ERU2]